MVEIISKSDAYFIGLFLGVALGGGTISFFGGAIFIYLVVLLIFLSFFVKTFWYNGYEHSEDLREIIVGCRNCGFNNMQMEVERNIVTSQTEYKVTIECDDCGNSITVRR